MVCSISTGPQTPNVRETLPIPFDALDSDCDEDGDEMMFDEVLTEIDRDETCSASSDDESVVADADEEDGEPQSGWPVLERDELLGFAKDEPALAKMWKSGWQLGKCF
ncbi:hypothetical protein DVH05_004866 [Phytophthora capsici]|nr:hypothetical protein DVH05_004866 [Phytophthora capsici]